LSSALKVAALGVIAIALNALTVSMSVTVICSASAASFEDHAQATEGSLSAKANARRE
jgi:hypothetical protein